MMKRKIIPMATGMLLLGGQAVLADGGMDDQREQDPTHEGGSFEAPGYDDRVRRESGAGGFDRMGMAQRQNCDCRPGGGYTSADAYYLAPGEPLEGDAVDSRTLSGRASGVMVDVWNVSAFADYYADTWQFRTWDAFSGYVLAQYTDRTARTSRRDTRSGGPITDGRRNNPDGPPR
jgi:hypothetical protein